MRVSSPSASTQIAGKRSTPSSGSSVTRSVTRSPSPASPSSTVCASAPKSMSRAPAAASAPAPARARARRRARAGRRAPAPPALRRRGTAAWPHCTDSDYDAVAMGDVLIWDSTERSPELRHELPIGIGDPFLYVERDGVRHVVIGSLEIPRVEELDGVEVHRWRSSAATSWSGPGMTRNEALLEIAARACTALGVARAQPCPRCSRSTSPTGSGPRGSSWCPSTSSSTYAAAPRRLPSWQGSAARRLRPRRGCPRRPSCSAAAGRSPPRRSRPRSTPRSWPTAAAATSSSSPTARSRRSGTTRARARSSPASPS